MTRRTVPEVAPTPEQLVRDRLVCRMAAAMCRIDGNRATASRYLRMARFALLEVEKSSRPQRIDEVSIG